MSNQVNISNNETTHTVSGNGTTLVITQHTNQHVVEVNAGLFLAAPVANIEDIANIGSGATIGQILKFDGSVWQPTDFQEGDLLPTGTTGQYLRYNGTDWIAVDLTTEDVLPTAGDGQYLQYNGGSWTAVDIQAGDTLPTATSGQFLQFDGTNWVGADVDSATLPSATAGQYLRYNGVEWEGASISVPTPSLSLNEITDVSTSGATATDVLTYNGNTWVAQAPATTSNQTISTTITNDTSNVVDSFATADYDTTTYQYLLINDTVGARAGQFIVVHNNGEIQYTDLSTQSTGNDTEPSIEAAINGTFVEVTVSSGAGYIFKATATRL